MIECSAVNHKGHLANRYPRHYNPACSPHPPMKNCTCKRKEFLQEDLSVFHVLLAKTKKRNPALLVGIWKLFSDLNAIQEHPYLPEDNVPHGLVVNPNSSCNFQQRTSLVGVKLNFDPPFSCFTNKWLAIIPTVSMSSTVTIVRSKDWLCASTDLERDTWKNTFLESLTLYGLSTAKSLVATFVCLNICFETYALPLKPSRMLMVALKTIKCNIFQLWNLFNP